MRTCKAILVTLFLAGLVQPVLGLPDLDVAYISRTPRYDRYNVSYQYGVDPNDYWTGTPYLTASEQTKQRWPNAGQSVTFTAVIKNPGNAATGAFAYKWYLDGVEVKNGALTSIAAGGQTSTTYNWTWDSEQNTHMIKFVADPSNSIAEDIETNNSREDPTNALTFRFHVWQSLYNWFRTNARTYAPQIASWDDWGQQQVYHMNRMFAEAVHPQAPNGMVERVRLDDILIEPDGTPDPGGTHAPEDIQWDGRWGFANGYLGPPNFYEQNPWVLQNYEGSLIHELSHQIGMIDMYCLNIENGANHIVATINHPNTREGGMMTGSYNRYSDHEAYSLNSGLHKRRGFFGEYLYDLPLTCKIRVLDAYYRPLPGATLTFYQDKDRLFDPPAKFVLTSDSQGYATLPNRTCYGSFTTATGHTLHDNPWGLINVVGTNAVFFVKIEAASQVDYQYMEILPFNIAYWSGFTDSFTYNFQANVIPGGRPTTGNINGVKLMSQGPGYAVGAGGIILRWNGTTWSSVSSPTTSNLNAVDQIASGLACAAGDSGTVLINSTGTWVKKTVGSANFRACAIASSSVIVVGGNSGTLYRSTNGGTSFTPLSVTANNIRSIRFLDANKGILVGEGPVAFYTTNGGASWIAGTGYPGNWIIDCSYPSASEAWACNDDGGILKSANGGATWTNPCGFGYAEPWYAIDMLPGATGWAAGRGHSFYGSTTIKRFEKGQFYNQALITFSPMDELYDISAVSENDAWLVGKSGALLRLIGENSYPYSQTTIPVAKALADGVGVAISGAIVTANFTGAVYIEQADRASGIKVLTQKTVAVGSQVVVTGVMGTDNGERVIRGGYVTVMGTPGALPPLGMPTKRLSGRTGYTGLDNVALLVTIAGNVTAYGTGWFTLDDGSGLTSLNGNAGIKVRCEGIAPPTSGFKLVTGISTLEMSGPTKYPIVRVRSSADIR
jgi:photosystem II stability/assembly factor-like uncharacterized protein